MQSLHGWEQQWRAEIAGAAVVETRGAGGLELGVGSAVTGWVGAEQAGAAVVEKRRDRGQGLSAESAVTG